MLSRTLPEQIRRRMAAARGPILSVYAPVSPDTRAAVAERVKASLDGAEAPAELVDALVEDLERTARGRTLVVFRAADREERIELDVDLPVADAQTGLVEVRCADEPWLLPLQMALEKGSRSAIVYVDRERVRLFETYLGEIELLDERERLPHAAYETPSPGKQVGDGAVRSDAHLDAKQAHEEELRDRLYREVIRDLVHTHDERGFERLLVVGIPRNVAAFLVLLPKALEDIAVPASSSLPDNQASPGRVLAELRPELDGLDRAHEEDILEQVTERGVKGLPEVLHAVQEGRADVVVLPWQLEGSVYEADTGWLAPDPEVARAFSTQQPRGSLPLADAIARLARDYGVRLEVLTGTRAEALRDRFGGIAALRRW